MSYKFDRSVYYSLLLSNSVLFPRIFCNSISFLDLALKLMEWIPWNENTKQAFSFMKIYMNISLAKCRQLFSIFNVLTTAPLLHYCSPVHDRSINSFSKPLCCFYTSSKHRFSIFGTAKNGSNFPGIISNAFALIEIPLFRFDFYIKSTRTRRWFWL